MRKLTTKEQLALLPISFLIVMFGAILAGGHLGSDMPQPSPTVTATPQPSDDANLCWQPNIMHVQCVNGHPVNVPASSIGQGGDDLPTPGPANGGDQLPGDK